MRVLAIGDLHTKRWIIDKVERAIDNYDVVIFVGDYADDWNTSPIDTIETWRQIGLLQTRYPEKVATLMGNHDFIYVHPTLSLASGYDYNTQFMINLPDNKAVKTWVYNCPIKIELDGVIYSHAGVARDWVELPEADNDYISSLWNDQSPIWLRPNSYEYLDTPQVFGHTPSETCWEVKPSIWCIDTFSTAYDGKAIGDCSVLEIEDGKKFTVKSLEEIIK